MTQLVGSGPRRSLWARLGLRARITIAFALGGLGLAALLAGATLYLTRQNLLAQREVDAVEVLSINAASVRQRLTPNISPEVLATLVQDLNTSQGSFPLIRIGQLVQAGNPQRFSVDDLPDSLTSLVARGEAGQMRTTINDEPMLLLGVALPEFGAEYFEAVRLTDIEKTLRSLSFILLGSSGTITVLAAALGIWASRRMLRPLSEVSDAAEAIASGALDTRLAAPADRDLASLAASFNEMAGALQERIERDARFASEVSHELRSPLMTLTASLAVLETRKHELSERARTAVELLSSDLERFKQLVEDLLEISRFDVGTARLDLEEVNLVEFVRRAVASASDHPMPVEFELGVDGTTIRADKRRLARVVSNLLDNAEKYGGGASRLEVSRVDGAVQLVVEDDGPGVPPGERSVIFDRFSRGGAGGRRGSDSGVGLGLSLVAEHVGLHGGRVWVEDRPDGAGGARFVVELPAEPERGAG